MVRDLTRCGAFTSSLCVHPDGKVSPCCQFDYEHLIDISDIDWQDPYKSVKDGRGCSACDHEGDVYMDAFNRFEAHDTFAVRHLDVRNNNLCSLECAICCSYYSSKWAERLGLPKFVSTDFNVPLDEVEMIYFAGGEPLLNPSHWEVLDKIPYPEQVELQYNSNLTYVNNIEKYWPRFKAVNVRASLDAVGELGEYLRLGMNWDKWQANLNIARQHATVIINPTISVLNIFHLAELNAFAKENDLGLDYNILTGPEYLCVNVLPLELKKQISFMPNKKHLRELLNEDRSFLFKDTINYILVHDRVKNTDIWKHLPFQKYAVETMDILGPYGRLY